MLKKVIRILLPFCFFSVSAHADFPENTLDLEDGAYFNPSMTEARFRQIIDSVKNLYTSVVSAHGARLMFEYRWTDSTVNAYATQIGNEWRVTMFGGMARRPELTEDGFAMVVCHELGHHLAGVSFYGAYDWASSEGQSDYFSTQACAKRLFAGSGANISKYKRIAKCDAVYTKNEDRAICYRSTAAGQSLANLLAKMEGAPAPSLATPDSTRVSSTFTSHPDAQCRLDTYFAGAVCTRSFPQNIIPGKDHRDTQTSVGAQTEAFKYSCSGTSYGARPRCWFAPK